MIILILRLHHLYVADLAGASNSSLCRFNPVMRSIADGLKTLPNYEMPTNYTTDCMKNMMNGKSPGKYLCKRLHYLKRSLEGAGGGQLSAEKKSWYVGAGRFIRALAYFNLVRNYDKLPLLTAPVTDPAPVEHLTRSEIGDVYSLIEADLLYASDSLPVAWPGRRIGMLPGPAGQGIPDHGRCAPE